MSLEKGSPDISLNYFNPPNTDTPLIQALSMAPSMSVLTGFNCKFLTGRLSIRIQSDCLMRGSTGEKKSFFQSYTLPFVPCE